MLDKTRPDVVLLAVVLPDIRGYEVCRMVRPGEGVNHRWDPDMPSARPDPWRRRLGDGLGSGDVPPASDWFACCCVSRWETIFLSRSPSSFFRSR